jgi:hypothetical protein
MAVPVTTRVEALRNVLLEIGFMLCFSITFVTVKRLKGSGVQGCILVPGLHFGSVFM